MTERDYTTLMQWSNVGILELLRIICIINVTAPISCIFFICLEQRPTEICM